MARPATKQDLEFLAKENYQKLLSLIETLPEKQREDSFPEGTMNRNICDVIGHLYHWHLLFLNWYEVGMRGEKPKIPKEGYTFSDTPKLNREIWEQCQKVSLAEILSLFEASHNKVFQLIQKHSDEKSFLPKRSIIGQVRPHSALT